MTEAEDKVLRIQAALDGELDAAGMLDFERICAEDPALAAEYARLKALDEALRRAAPVEPAPDSLRARIAALAEPPQTRQPAKTPLRFAAPPRALAASLLLGAVLGYGGALMRPNAPDPERTLVSAFMRTQISGQSVDIATSERHVVKPWLAGRAPLAITAVDLAAAGFPLAGGRVEALDGRIVPTLVYKRREHRIEVTELPLSEADSDKSRNAGFDGFHVARWSDADRAYIAVTDLPAIELAQFVDLFRAAVAGEREGAGAGPK
ncbi:anti-sigma factor [Rhodoblastus sp.]|uniref:anti-sigma factor family protein n=1 Tax=Rhodoblastus sp. TaxID=1962975 RepID=UPI0035AFB246